MSASVENVLYSNICRLCCGRKALLSIFDGDPVDLLDTLLFTLPSLEFDQNDGKPEHICTDCCNKLIEYKIFIHECIKVDRLFNELLERPQSEVEHIDFDIEPRETKKRVNSCYLPKKQISRRHGRYNIDDNQSRLLDLIGVKEEFIELDVEGETEHNKILDKSVYEVQVYQSDVVNEVECQEVSTNEVVWNVKSSKGLEEKSTGINQQKSINIDNHLSKLTYETEWRESCTETSRVDVCQDVSAKDNQCHDSQEIIEQVDCEIDYGQKENLITLHVDKQHNSEIDDIVQEVIVGYTEECDAQTLIDEAQRLESEMPNSDNGLSQNIHQDRSILCDIITEPEDDYAEELCTIAEQINSQTPPPKKKRAPRMKGPFICQVCSKRLKSGWQLKQHMNIHGGVRIYKCDKCSKAYYRLAELNTHKKIHKNIHVCSYCGKCFSVPFLLARHLQVHTGVKPVQCEICGKLLSTSCYLKLHLRAHYSEESANKYKCEVCEKEFQTKLLLRHHCENEHNKSSSKLKCEVCEEQFLWMRDFRKHVKQHNLQDGLNISFQDE